MSISNTAMAALQSAGQALAVAHSALAAAAQEQAARVAQAMASNPFGLENDSHFEQWKAVARMAQALEAMEGQMKTIFQTAGEIALHAPAPSPAPRALASPRLTARADLACASDVTSRPAKSTRQAHKAPRRAAVAPAPVVALRGNAQQLMRFMSSRLGRRAYVRMTHGEIAEGASLPRGSVGAALSALVQKGLLLEGERGSYKLS